MALDAPGAVASSASGCPPQTPQMLLAHARLAEPFSGVVAVIPCLPIDETLSSVTIDWGDEATSSGTVDFRVEPGGASKSALVHGEHTYLTPTCAAGVPCGDGFQPRATAVTASDGEARHGGGYEIVVSAPAPVGGPIGDPPAPPPVTTGVLPARPSVRRIQRRVLLSPHVRVTCAAASPCVARVEARRRGDGRLVAIGRRDLAAGASATPTAFATRAMARRLLAHGTVRAVLTVSVASTGSSATAPATARRVARLRL